MKQTIKKVFGRFAPVALLSAAMAMGGATSAFAEGHGGRERGFAGGRYEDRGRSWGGGYRYSGPVREERREYRERPRGGFYFGFGTPYYTAPAPVYRYSPAPACGYYDQWGYWHEDPACYAPYYGYPR